MVTRRQPRSSGGTARTATLADVARLAGVSLATASRVLNGSARQVGPSFTSVVLCAAAELGYSPNGPAQAMSRGHTTTVGMVAPDIADPYFTQLFAGATAQASVEGLHLSIGVHHGDPAREVDQVRAFRSQWVRGLVVAGSRWSNVDPQPMLDALADTPAVVIGEPLGALPQVRFADGDAARALAETVVGLGYRRVVILRAPAGHLTSSERSHAMESLLQEAGVPTLVQEEELSRDGGYVGMGRALAQVGSQVEGLCVMAITDLTALGAMTALHEAGLEPGRRVGVTGFNDLPLLADLRPGLTTVRLPLREAGEAAVKALLEGSWSEAPFTGTVIVRDSTPPQA